MNHQPNLLNAERRTTAIVVLTDTDLDRTIEGLRDLGAVILSLNVKGATYTLSVTLPPGEVAIREPTL